MKALTLIVAAVAVSPVAFGQTVQFKVESSGIPAGTASITQKLLSDGRKTNLLKLEITAPNGSKVTVRTESAFTAKGAQERVFHETMTEKPVSRRQVTATFSGQIAKTIVDEGGKRTVKDVPLVDAAPRENPAEFWFLKTQPKVNETVQFYYFDVVKVEWVLKEATYLGKTPLKIGAKTHQAHHVKGKDADAWFDSSGLPLKIVGETFVMTRIP